MSREDLTKYFSPGEIESYMELRDMGVSTNDISYISNEELYELMSYLNERYHTNFLPDTKDDFVDRFSIFDRIMRKEDKIPQSAGAADETTSNIPQRAKSIPAEEPGFEKLERAKSPDEGPRRVLHSFNGIKNINELIRRKK